MPLLIFIALLVALIWVHELGHFSAAKLFRIRVDEFSIGFPPRLFKIKWGETLYSFGALLIGGFVRIHGEEPGDSKDSRSMAAKPRAVQALVVAAGILMNLLFAWLLLSAGYMAGTKAALEEHPKVTDAQVTILNVLPNSPAEKAGLMPGDVIEEIITGSASVEAGENADAVTGFIAAHGEESLIFNVVREGAAQSFLVRAEDGIVEGRKAVGIHMASIGMLALPPHEALIEGAQATYSLTLATAEGLLGFFGKLFSGQAAWSEVSGPVGIAGVGSQAVQEGFSAAVFITALISINLALFNLVPIPGLDGFRLALIGVEAVIRRPVPGRLLTGLSVVGFALVIGLMVAVTYHDIARLVG